MWDPAYSYTPWTPERREQAAAIARARHGAPDGYCTVMGNHVPIEHRQPVKLFAYRLSQTEGSAVARRFVEGLQVRDWQDMPALWSLYERTREVSEIRELIRLLEWEAYFGDRDNR